MILLPLVIIGVVISLVEIPRPMLLHTTIYKVVQMLVILPVHLLADLRFYYFNFILQRRLIVHIHRLITLRSAVVFNVLDQGAIILQIRQ